MAEIIRAKEKRHFKAIAALAESIWHQHYTPIIGTEQVRYMLSKYQSPRAIENQTQKGMEYYMIKLNQDLVGYLAIEKKGEALFLSKIYVDQAQRGKGYGQKAMAFISEKAKEYGCDRISLTVNKHNTNSIEAYKKMSFSITKELVMDIGKGFVMDDYAMEKLL